MDDSATLNTENLWLLMALVTMLENENYPPLALEHSGADFKSKTAYQPHGNEKHSQKSTMKQPDANPVYYLVNAKF